MSAANSLSSILELVNRSRGQAFGQFIVEQRMAGNIHVSKRIYNRSARGYELSIK
jgi:hypothetical protein